MIFIDNGKKPNELLNANIGFWLPSNSPFGNFQLKHMTLIFKLDEANRKIEESYKYWSQCDFRDDFQFGSLERHIIANEQLIYLLRRVADELISLIWCLSKYELEGTYPKKIKVDRIGSLLKQDQNGHEVFSEHHEVLNNLNNISNAFKHSFINSNIMSLRGAEEPRLHALDLDYNNINKEPVFYDVSLIKLIEGYNSFYKGCISWLSKYSERNR